MTAGQIAAPYRQIRTSLLLAALAAAFGLGLLIGLVAQRASNPGALAISNGGAPEAVAAANSRVSAPAVDTGASNLRGAQDYRAAAGGSSIGVAPVLDPKPYLTPQGGLVFLPSGGFSSAPGIDPSDSSAASTGSGTYADALALLRAKREGGAAATFGAVHKPYPL